MLSRLRGFVNRHKRKFIISGILIGGTIVTCRFIYKKLQEFQERQAKEFIEKTKRLSHFESTERTCNQAIFGLSCDVFNEIIKILNTSEILDKLRNNPKDKIELWENLKVISFTRLATFVYASSMLVIALRVKVNLLGGYLYKDTISDEKKISESAQLSYLSLIQYFLTDGLPNLINLIKSKVKDTLNSYALDSKLNLSDIEQIFWSIQMAVNSDKNDPNSKIAKYVLPSSINEISESNNIDVEAVLQKLFEETLDMLESDDVSVLCSNNVSRGFSIVVDNIAEYYSETVKSNGINDKPASTKTDLNETPIVNINKIELPLAKLIPIINGLTFKTCEITTKQQNLASSLVTFFLISDKLKTLGANVYEVFST